MSRLGLLLAACLFLSAPTLLPQAKGAGRHDPDGRVEIFGEYSRTHDTYPQYVGLNGFDIGGAAAVWHALAIKGEVSRYSGTDIGAESQFIVVVGPRYSVRFGPESVFVEGMIGRGHVDAPNLYDNTGRGSIVFATVLGGGLDTRISDHVAFRVEGNFLHAKFTPSSDQIHGTPTWYGRFSTGLVVRF